MARTANRYLQRNQNKFIRKKYQVGIYLRLSVDSDYTGSDSLENQNQLARDYLEKCDDIDTVKVYIDDGETGTNFERPGFARMMSELRQNIINCIIVKDLSRFGREYLESGNYIEKVFPFLGVRFISVIDNYDSLNPDCDKDLLLISLKNLMHEMYAKDISKKVGSTYKMKQQNREFYRSSTIPYGYQIDERNLYSVGEAAFVVKEIFHFYANGMSKYAISQWLYDNKICTPRQYIETGKVYADDTEVKVWQLSTIDRILKNSVYVGTIVRHKSEQSIFEGKGKTKISMDEQVIINNNHIPVISKELFSEVQKRLEDISNEYLGYKADVKPKSNKEVFETNVFDGKIYCAGCNAKMIRVGTYRMSGGLLAQYKIYKCSTHRQIVSRCDARYVSEEELSEIIYKSIQIQLNLIKGINKKIQNDIRFSFVEKIIQIDKEEHRTENGRALLQAQYIKKYSDYKRTQNLEEFKKYRTTFKEKIKYYEKQTIDLKKRRKQIKKYESALNTLVKEWLNIEKKSILTASMVDSYIEEIKVNANNRIEIKFKYQDCFSLATEWLEGVII